MLSIFEIMSQELAINEQLSKKIRDNCKQWQNPKQQFRKILKFPSLQSPRSLRQPPRPSPSLPSEGGDLQARRTERHEPRCEWSPCSQLNLLRQLLRQQVLRLK